MEVYPYQKCGYKQVSCNYSSTMKKQFLLTITVFILLSCVRRKDENLLIFKAKYYRELSEKEFLNFTKIEPKINQKRLKDTLKIKVDFIGSGCNAFDGDINFSNDTLYLIYWSTSKEVCEELVYYRLNYKILNKSNNNYKVKLIRR